MFWFCYFFQQEENLILNRTLSLESDSQLLMCGGISGGGEQNGEWSHPVSVESYFNGTWGRGQRGEAVGVFECLM